MHLGAIVAMVIIGKSASVAFFCKCSLLLFESMQCSVKLHWKMHFVQLLPIVFAAAAEAQQCARHPIRGKCIGGEAPDDAAAQWGGWCTLHTLQMQ